MSELTSVQRRSLRALAHSLQPVVSVAGNGLTDSVLAEIDRSLTAHELIKIRTYGIERDDREAVLAEICARLGCAPVQHIGNLLVVYRERPAEADDAPRAPRAPKGRQTKKQLSGDTPSRASAKKPVRTSAKAPAKPAARRSVAQPAPAAAPRRRATPNPPRRANNTRGR